MLLLGGNSDNGAFFSGKDTQSKFNANLEQQPADWVWRSKEVRYTLNTQQYRAPEWQHCRWSESILVFGCSMVYGVGVNDTETLPYYLSTLLGKPVTNLGMGGTGIAFHLANSVILREHNITPKAVVCVWPDRSRQTEFIEKLSVVHHGAWNVETSWLKNLILNDVHCRHNAEYLIRTMRLLWNCPIVEASWYEDMCNITGSTLLKFHDLARDCAHPGPETQKIAANLIAEKLQQIG